MKRILCVHQGTEKYGSDKSFVSAVAALNSTGEFDTKVLLPGEGPIRDLLDEAGIHAVETRPIWVLRKAGFIRAMTLGMPKNILCVLRAMRDLRQYDMTYVNTAVILDFFIASIFTRQSITVHVREIPVGIAMKVIRRLLIASKARVIFNSEATKNAFKLPEHTHQTVIYNGFTPPKQFGKQKYDGNRKLNLLCIGRLNSWKGQEVLVDACALVPENLRERLHLRIVGGVYKGQMHFREALIARIKDQNLGAVIDMVDFTDDPSEEYLKADVVVVPSTLPEPFGRVAIEGMAYECAIIATNHGGLTEIVQNGQTGKLVEPSDAQGLCDAICALIQQPQLVGTFGNAGMNAFSETFTQDACDMKLIKFSRLS